MLYNSKTIMKYIKDPRGRAEPAQVGVDLTLMLVREIKNDAVIPLHGKTMHAEMSGMMEVDAGNCWHLRAGKAYAATLDQGLENLPDNMTAMVVQRSSLNRNGCIVMGSIYDPGYGCENLGCTIYPTEDIYIESHARICQITIQGNQPVDAEALYDGQYKGE